MPFSSIASIDSLCESHIITKSGFSETILSRFIKSQFPAVGRVLADILSSKRAYWGTVPSLYTPVDIPTTWEYASSIYNPDKALSIRHTIRDAGCSSTTSFPLKSVTFKFSSDSSLFVVSCPHPAIIRNDRKGITILYTLSSLKC